MGYYVRALPGKKCEPRWKIQFVSFRAADASKKRRAQPRKEWDVPRESWLDLGFHPSMSFDAAKTVQRHLNLELVTKRREERRREADEAFRIARANGARWFPEDMLVEFERQFLFCRFSTRSRAKDVRAQWRCAQRVISSIDLPPSDWALSPHHFYDFFFERKYSLSYLQKVMRLVNLWGYFVSRQLQKPFLPVPAPRGVERRRLLEEYLTKCNGRSSASLPLKPQILESSRARLSAEHYRWLYLSIWLGLRPSEVDRLKDRSQWRLDHDGRRVAILWVHQTKLTMLPHRDRWKGVPLVSAEQRAALEMIREGSFSRPSARTVSRCVGDGIRLYGGRKGFTDLMLERGYPLEFISQWMGHSSIERTWRSYKDRSTVHYFRRPAAE